jgi:hypothetical protein
VNVYTNYPLILVLAGIYWFKLVFEYIVIISLDVVIKKTPQYNKISDLLSSFCITLPIIYLPISLSNSVATFNLPFTLRHISSSSSYTQLT